MTRRVLLVEIGTPAALPVVTPPAPRPPSAWVPIPRPSSGLPPPTGLAAEPIADAAVLTWTPSTAGGQTIIEAAPTIDGVPGLWRELDRTGADTYTISLPGGAVWVRVRAELNGRTSVASNAVLAEPVRIGDITQLEQELRALQDLVDAVAAQAAAEAAALNARADDLRDDIDATIATVSALADLTDDLGTEITRVETESIDRDTATVETISLLGAKNADGTAFILDANTLQLSPEESLAQWRASVQGAFAAQSSRIDNEAQARQDGDQALATTLATVQATANNAATKAELTAAQTALAAADQAEANARNALAVQLRGGYAGTDPAALTQGLIYNERRARITAEGAIASVVNAMQLDLDGKASADALAATQLAVTQQGNTLTSHGQQLSGLSASVGDNEASINELREVSASAIAGNGVINPSFESDVGWGEVRGSNSLPDGVYYWPYQNARTGTRVIRFDSNGTIYNAAMVPVTHTGEVRYGITWRTAPTPANNGAEVVVYLQGYDSSGNPVPGTLFGQVATVNGASNYAWLEGSYTVPPQVTAVGMVVRVRNRVSGGILIDDAYINPVTETLANVLARWTFAVQAGGDVVGMQLLAGGGISAIRFLASMFSVIDPGGNDALEWSNGSIRVVNSNVVRVRIGRLS